MRLPARLRRLERPRLRGALLVLLAVALAVSVTATVTSRFRAIQERQAQLAEVDRLMSHLAGVTAQQAALNWRYVDVQNPDDRRLGVLARAAQDDVARLQEAERRGDVDATELVEAFRSYERRQAQAASAPIEGRVRIFYQGVASERQQVLYDVVGDRLDDNRAALEDVRRQAQVLGTSTVALCTLSVLAAVAQWRRTLVRLRRAGYEDRVTGLPNRRALRRLLDRAADRSGPGPAVILLDLDDFKDVNDTHGHLVGDDLLRGVGQRLRRVVGTDGVAGRLGGDEFAVVLRRGSDHLDVARRVSDAFAEPFSVASTVLQAQASVGLNPPGSTDDPLHAADLAMYEAKRAGKKGLQVFTAELAEAAHRRAALRADLRLALDRGELRVAYQAVTDLVTGELVLLEALARWDHPVQGAVSPGTFIPLAESMGTIGDIDEFVLRQAAQDAVRLGVDVSVNVSPRHLGGGRGRRSVSDVLAATGLPPGRLVVEVTETALATEDVCEELATLRAGGVRIALDDFGTGQSSLSRLAALPVDILKVAGTFVSGIPEGATVGGTVGGTEGGTEGGTVGGGTDTGRDLLPVVAILARRLRLRTVVEGLETEAQVRMVRDLGFDLGQGYVLGRPQDTADAAVAGLRRVLPAPAGAPAGPASLPPGALVPHPAPSADGVLARGRPAG